ncbi:hypothetical protein ACHAXR_009257 [Thalassiosira sp. AJA248-18]
MALHRRRHRQQVPDEGRKLSGDRQDGASQRQKDETTPASPSAATTSIANDDASLSSGPNISAASPLRVTDATKEGAAQTFYVTKFIIIRLVGFVYLIAFMGAFNQNRGLMGSHGLVPARNYMDQLRTKFDSPVQGFVSHPSIYWFIGTSLED